MTDADNPNYISPDTPLTEAQKKLVADHLDLIPRLLRRWSSKSVNMREELEAAAQEILIRCAQIHDPSHGQFSRYALKSIKYYLIRAYNNLKPEAYGEVSDDNDGDVLHDNDDKRTTIADLAIVEANHPESIESYFNGRTLTTHADFVDAIAPEADLTADEQALLKTNTSEKPKEKAVAALKVQRCLSEIYNHLSTAEQRLAAQFLDAARDDAKQAGIRKIYLEKDILNALKAHHAATGKYFSGMTPKIEGDSTLAGRHCSPVNAAFFNGNVEGWPKGSTLSQFKQTYGMGGQKHSPHITWSEELIIAALEAHHAATGKYFHASTEEIKGSSALAGRKGGTVDDALRNGRVEGWPKGTTLSQFKQKHLSTLLVNRIISETDLSDEERNVLKAETPPQDKEHAKTIAVAVLKIQRHLSEISEKLSTIEQDIATKFLGGKKAEAAKAGVKRVYLEQDILVGMHAHHAATGKYFSGCTRTIFGVSVLAGIAGRTIDEAFKKGKVENWPEDSTLLAFKLRNGTGGDKHNARDLLIKHYSPQMIIDALEAHKAETGKYFSANTKLIEGESTLAGRTGMGIQSAFLAGHVEGWPKGSTLAEFKRHHNMIDERATVLYHPQDIIDALEAHKTLTGKYFPSDNTKIVGESKFRGKSGGGIDTAFKRGRVIGWPKGSTLADFKKERVRKRKEVEGAKILHMADQTPVPFLMSA